MQVGSRLCRDASGRCRDKTLFLCYADNVHLYRRKHVYKTKPFGSSNTVGSAEPIKHYFFKAFLAAERVIGLWWIGIICAQFMLWVCASFQAKAESVVQKSR